ncbi:MAG: methyltransferase domain-containing protein [Bacteroidota bacterium]
MMDNFDQDFDIVKNLKSNSPYKPEVPQKKFMVSLIMQLAKWLKCQGLYTPHSYGGSNFDKLEFEYQAANYLFEVVDTIDLSFFDQKDVLDVGCGWGGKMIYYAGHSKLKSISGFDLPDVYIPAVSYEYADEKKITNCVFKTGYAEDIPFGDEAFDVIIMEDVMEHVRDPQKVLAECYRVLRNTGMIIVKFPSIKMMYAHHLDRAISFPALHYILSLKTWARGLNYLLARGQYHFDPFEEVVVSKFSKWQVTNSLNGLDFKSFVNLVNQSRFEVETLECRPFGRKNQRDSLIRLLYRCLYNTGIFTEFLSSFILFVGRKVDG